MLQNKDTVGYIKYALTCKAPRPLESVREYELVIPLLVGTMKGQIEAVTLDWDMHREDYLNSTKRHVQPALMKWCVDQDIIFD